jgi:glycosyltransferase involved in cell wall biosynthesis
VTRLVSVLVCSRNYGRYLPAAVASVAAQSHGPIELWIVDDASTDASRDVARAVVDRLRDRFERAELVGFRRNRGKLGCLNWLLQHTAGELVVILDADDVLHPSFVEASITHLDAHRGRDPGVGFVYTDCRLIDRDGAPLGTGRSLRWDAELLLRSSYIPDCAVTVASALRAAVPFDERVRVGTKHHKWLRLVRAGWRGEYLPRPLFSYRMHDRNASGIGARVLRELAAGTADPVLGPFWPRAERYPLRSGGP